MSTPEDRQIRERLSALRAEHRTLDNMITALEASDSRDQLQIRRLKKQKLKLKDEMNVLEAMLHPDIIA
jgi:hypothetical protein